ncbi:glycerol-3-phosphate 1-O-acyltransferase PlsY [[Mycoplasma] anseris]|nr:glycerol-3-phosphate 1-O-acyltransferase PlsY [[Mycoplasma] anseris]
MIGTYIWINFILFLIGYFIGSINLGIIISKIKGQDIRLKGSGNAGATNVLRNMGFKFAFFVFSFDFFKSFLPTLIVLLTKHYANVSNNDFIIPLSIGFGALIGHVFPLYFKFKGGKGVACFFGIVLAFNFILFVIFVSLYVLILVVSNYVSLTSAISSFIIAILCCLPLFDVDHVLAIMLVNVPVIVNNCIISLCAIVIIFKHYRNYVRIINKTESKLFKW